MLLATETLRRSVWKLVRGVRGKNKFEITLSGTLVIDRDVVLLTHDRILQLKATTHERFVPVAEVQPLMSWLRLTVAS